jgi:hypothetical protein
VVGLIVIAAGLWVVGIVLNQIAMHRARAVWIQNNSLFYLNHYGSLGFNKVPLELIASVKVGRLRFWQPTGLLLVPKNGSELYLPTVLLREKREEILLKICAVVPTASPCFT